MTWKIPDARAGKGSPPGGVPYRYLEVARPKGRTWQERSECYLIIYIIPQGNLWGYVPEEPEFAIHCGSTTGRKNLSFIVGMKSGKLTRNVVINGESVSKEWSAT